MSLSAVTRSTTSLFVDHILSPTLLKSPVRFVLPPSSRWPCQPGTQVHATEDRRGGHVQPSADDPDAAAGGRQRSDSGCAPSTPGVGHPSQQSSCLPLQQVPDSSGALTIFAATADQSR